MESQRNAAIQASEKLASENPSLGSSHSEEAGTVYLSESVNVLRDLGKKALLVAAVHDAETLKTIGRNDDIDHADIIEIRLDLVAQHRGILDEVLSHIRKPILITARHPSEGGNQDLSDSDRLDLLESYMPFAAFLDVEISNLKAMRGVIERAQQNGIKIVGSFHDFNGTPSLERLNDAYVIAESCGADLVKVSCAVRKAQDLIPLISFLASEDKLPKAVMGMGSDYGRVSRLLLAKAGSALNYGYAGINASVPGQIPIHLFRSWLGAL